jgi:hypothetical protein
MEEVVLSKQVQMVQQISPIIQENNRVIERYHKSMVRFEELEFKIKQSRGNYSFTDDGQGKRTYTIFSEDLKQSLRDTIHSTFRAGEWQVNHTLGASCIKYRQEQNGKFGLYQKGLDENIPDEFVVLSEDRNSVDRKDFEADRQQFSESNQVMDEHRRQIENSQHSSSQGHQFPRSGEGAYVSYDGDENILREAFGILDRERRERNSASQTQTDNNRNQQRPQVHYETQTRQVNFPFLPKPKGN